jgi:hypothetical protein
MTTWIFGSPCCFPRRETGVPGLTLVRVAAKVGL